MKKLMLMFSAAVMLVLSSCGSSNEEIAQKIQQKITLTQSEKKHMIEYCADANKAQIDLVAKAKEKSWTNEEKAEKAIELDEDYPYYNLFSNNIGTYLNKKNRELKEKLENEYEKLAEEKLGKDDWQKELRTFAQDVQKGMNPQKD